MSVQHRSYWDILTKVTVPEVKGINYKGDFTPPWFHLHLSQFVLLDHSWIKMWSDQEKAVLVWDQTETVRFGSFAVWQHFF